MHHPCPISLGSDAAPAWWRAAAIAPGGADRRKSAIKRIANATIASRSCRSGRAAFVYAVGQIELEDAAGANFEPELVVKGAA
ncbi:MAG: hypothetical protein ACXWLR_15455 [Myxococcales bacterium]